MASLNKVQIIGHLGKDPEIKTTPQGKKVANFSVGVSEKYTDRNGQSQQKTEWFSVVMWDGNSGRGLASICEQYLKKGSSVYIEGRLETRSWDDPIGVKKYRTEVRGSILQMLGGKSDNSTTTNQTPDNSNNNDDFGSYDTDDNPPF
jgi:single-strand DNA-binding protein